LASWLVGLFAAGERAASIEGDLLEEFSELVSRSGVGPARRWYWRQSVKTAAALAGCGFRAAPWSTLAVALAGYLLFAAAASLPERVTVAVLQAGWHDVTPYYTWRQAQNYLFWLNNGVWIGRLLLPLLVGCAVAAVAKGRELATTLALCAVNGVATGLEILLLSAGHAPEYPFFLPLLLVQFANSVLMVTGGVITREIRSIRPRRVARG